MQLFLIENPGKILSITDPVLTHQMSRVLRMREGDHCFLQWADNKKTTRTEVVLTTISKKEITFERVDHETKQGVSSNKRIAIAWPNKPAKMELIVQKLTELGVDEIIFFKAERSQPGAWNDKKALRIQTIVKEATEQCRGWNSPTVSYYDSLKEIPGVETYIVTDIPGHISGATLWKKGISSETVSDQMISNKQLFLIGPEGGRGEKEYNFFDTHMIKILELGDRILRMETAAIIVGGILTI